MRDPRTRNSLGFALVAVVAAVAFSMAQPADRTGTLTAPLAIPMMMGGKQVGSSTAPAGTKVKILKEDGTKVLVATAAGQAWTTGVTMDAPATVEPVVPQVAQPTASPTAASTAKPTTTAPKAIHPDLQEILEMKVTGKKIMQWYNPPQGMGNDFTQDIIRELLEKYGENVGNPEWIIFATKESEYDGQTGIRVPAPITDAKATPNSEPGFDAFVWSSVPDLDTILRQLKLGAVVFIHETIANEITNTAQAEVKALRPSSQIGRELKALLPSVEPGKSFKLFRKGNLVVYTIDGGNSGFRSLIRPPKSKTTAHGEGKHMEETDAPAVKAFMQRFMEEAAKKVTTPAS